MKTVLITGASRGIGAETVRAFAEKGYTVIANYNKSHDKAVALRDEMVSRGFDVHIFQADVSDSSQVEKMFCHIKIQCTLIIKFSGKNLVCEDSLQTNCLYHKRSNIVLRLKNFPLSFCGISIKYWLNFKRCKRLADSKGGSFYFYTSKALERII